MEDKLNKLIKDIDHLNAYNPKEGLPDSVFYFVGRNTPFINVDLIIRDINGSILMTWRDDKYCGQGWHIPGGIIRFQEKIEDRIKIVAKTELGISVLDQSKFLAINEIVVPNKRDRSHFISLLYECYLNNKNLELINKIANQDDRVKFFRKAPNNLLAFHDIYAKYFKN